MDLRKNIKNIDDLKKAIHFIKNGTLFYQPFTFDDNLVVGEGRNFVKKYDGAVSLHDKNLYHNLCSDRWGINKNDLPDLSKVMFNGNEIDRITITEDEKDFFIKINNEYDGLYDFFIDKILEDLQEPPESLTFAEIGCNTGVTLLKLAEMNAKKVYGYDWSDYNELFDWFNKILDTNTNVNFQRGYWDNLRHNFCIYDEDKSNDKDFLKKNSHLIRKNRDKFELAMAMRENIITYDIPEVDVMINTIYTNHQYDPMQFIAQCCDKAKKAVFFWMLIHPSSGDKHVIKYPDALPHENFFHQHDLPFPLNYRNDVRMSVPLIRSVLQACGFSDFKCFQHPNISPEFESWGVGENGDWKMFYAKRTDDIKSGFSITNLEFSTQKENFLKNEK